MLLHGHVHVDEMQVQVPTASMSFALRAVGRLNLSTPTNPEAHKVPRTLREARSWVSGPQIMRLLCSGSVSEARRF